jgi:O-antigen/teichoic acid export membrane protein
MLHRYSVGSVVVLAVGKLITYGVVYKFFEFTLRAAIVADSIAFLLTYAFLLVAHWRLCRPPPSAHGYRPDARELGRLRRYALANNFNESSSLLLHVQTDNFFIAALMTPVAVGAYAFYARLNEMCANLIPTRLFENVVQPLFFSTKPEQAAERLPRYVTLLINLSMTVQWPLFAYTLVYHRQLIELVFHGKFVEYSSLLPVIIGFALTNNVISTPITMTALFAERASLILKSQLFGLYQVAAMLILVPILGLYGAAIATGTLHLFRNLWVWWHVRDSARWTNFRPAVASGILIWALAIGVCMAGNAVLKAPPMVHLIVGALVCAVATLIYLRSPAICESDRQILAGVLHGRESTLLRWFGLAPAATQGAG